MVLLYFKSKNISANSIGFVYENDMQAMKEMGGVLEEEGMFKKNNVTTMDMIKLNRMFEYI